MMTEINNVVKSNWSGFLIPFFRNLFIRFAAGIYFRKIIIAGFEHLPGDGCVVLACNHRNGAIDGAVVKYALPQALFTVGRNLTRSFFLRMIFGGQIDVYRTSQNESERKDNQDQILQAALASCAGVPLVIFPEGTSKLGPSLLPLKKGIYYLVRTIFEIRKDAQPVYVVPVGLHYQRGWAFQSDVFITMGRSWKITTDDVKDVDSFMAKIKENIRKVTISYEDKDEQMRAEAFADLVSCVTPVTHLEACRLYAAKMIPDYLLQKYNLFYSRMSKGARRGMPLVFDDHGILRSAFAMILTPVVALAFAVNIIPCLAALIMARIMADDDNVITLWRCLVGLPLLMLQWMTSMAVLLTVGSPMAMAGFILLYAFLTALGVRLFSHWKYGILAGINCFILPGEEILDLIKEVRKWQKTRH